MSFTFDEVASGHKESCNFFRECFPEWDSQLLDRERSPDEIVLTISILPSSHDVAMVGRPTSPSTWSFYVEEGTRS